MARAGILPVRIFTSPYLRARQTAAAVARAFPGREEMVEVMPEMASGARWENVREALLPHGGLEAALLVGHQPDLSEMTAEILGGGPAVSYAPASLACLRVDAVPPLRPGALEWARRSEELARLSG